MMEQIRPAEDPNDSPKYLYKYRNFENDYHLRVLTDNEVFFTSPKHFNDPFDSRFHFKYDTATWPEFFHHWDTWLTRRNSTWDRKERKRNIKEWFKSGFHSSSEGIQRTKQINE